MYTSSVIQHFIEQRIKKGLNQGFEQGLNQGRKKAALEVLIEILEFRFPPNEVQSLKPILENIKELQQLRQLRHNALQVSSIDEFKHILSSNGNDI